MPTSCLSPVITSTPLHIATNVAPAATAASCAFSFQNKCPKMLLQLSKNDIVKNFMKFDYT